MRKFIPLLLALATLAPGRSPAADAKVASSGGISPHETISAVIGGRGGPRVTITYGRPFSKDPKSGAIRKVWGTLVPWEKAWRLGSDEATTIISEQPLDLGGLTIQGGVAYTLYMVPSENGTSKLAVSTRIGKWGIPVDETKDLGRVDLKKDALPSQLDELTLAIENVPAGGGVLKIMWENTQFSLPFTVKK
ncbi:MAG TPA: DUF2911 domain-containing protein [Opitutaceae bacterium]|nr:DUF2911 domain-containing protein [Opitutaceae bacterium]